MVNAVQPTTEVADCTSAPNFVYCHCHAADAALQRVHLSLAAWKLVVETKCCYVSDRVLPVQHQCKYQQFIDVNGSVT